MFTFLRMKQVVLRGMTGLLQFSERGERERIELEILNLQNNYFKRVGVFYLPYHLTSSVFRFINPSILRKATVAARICIYIYCQETAK